MMNLQRPEQREEYWILNEAHEPISADLDAFLEWESDPTNSRVDYTMITPTAYVSTLFMCVNLDIRRDMFPGLQLPPLLFETCAFDGEDMIEMRRSYTWHEAEAAHSAVVEEMEARMTKVAE